MVLFVALGLANKDNNKADYIGRPILNMLYLRSFVIMTNNIEMLDY